jgi:hypothetical protein
MFVVLILSLICCILPSGMMVFTGFALIIYTVVAVLIGIILEFFVFGGDYTRTERLEYEDDDYYYYVKAVPKALVATSERSIKKINGEADREERRTSEKTADYTSYFPQA